VIDASDRARIHRFRCTASQAEFPELSFRVPQNILAVRRPVRRLDASGCGIYLAARRSVKIHDDDVTGYPGGFLSMTRRGDRESEHDSMQPKAGHREFMIPEMPSG